MLHEIVGALTEMYGPINATITDPFEIVLLENAAYLVDDARRMETFIALRDDIGLTPEAILEHSADEIAQVIEHGGMQPSMRAGKVIDSARIGTKIGIDVLRAEVKRDAKKAKKMLREFPSVGEPYADRILLFAGSQLTLAPDSNALRVLVRLGYAAEDKNYTKMYRAAVAATNSELVDARFARQAHLLLRRHGREICTRSDPRCDICILRKTCPWPRRKL